MRRNKNISFGKLQDELEGELFTDELRRYMLSTDGSIFRKMPVCVVCPRSSRDVAATVRFAGEHALSVHSRGAGSGLCGSAIGEGIVLDFSKYMNRLIALDTDNKTFTCEPGFRFGELEKALGGRGLFFPPDPSSGEYATFGGMYGTNASGAHSVRYGNVADYILDAEVVFASGTIAMLSEIRENRHLPDNLNALSQMYTDHADTIEQEAYPATRFNTAGYNLRGLVRDGKPDLRCLFAGSEGTLGVVTRLTFRLIDKPAHDSLVVAFMDDIVSSAKAVQKILPMNPSGIEIMDKSLLRLAKSHDESLRDAIPDGVDNVLLIEFDASDAAECMGKAAEVRELLRAGGYSANVHMAVSASEKAAFWAVRKAAVPILYKLKGDRKILALIEDAAVPTDRLVTYFEGIYEILNRHQVEFVTYGHIAKGLLHTRPLLNLKDAHDVDLLRAIADDLFELVRGLDGSVSGEHGDGRLRSAYIRPRFREIYDLFLQTKTLLDPDRIFNPEIITHHDPDQMKKNLRFGPAYENRGLPSPALNWPEGLTREIEKCHGCSKCTTVTTATRMCPVYKATRDETAAPKAKANILRALISGAIEEKNLYAAAFQQVIDQCVNCGSCARECPSNVNIPKMAMEARAQYVKKFGPSPTQRLVTGAELAGRLTHKFSGRLRPVMNHPLVRKAGACVTGISAERETITFAAKPLNRRVPAKAGNGDIRVLYFAGCYASYIEPAIGQALVRVLRHMGMTVYTPPQHCCGLPMLSKGMTGEARRKMMQNFEKWGELLNKVDYITVSCSSCGYALMNDWAYLTNDERVRTVSRKTVHITKLIGDYSDRLRLKPGSGRLAYHAPCHLRIQPHGDSSLKLLSRLEGVNVNDLKDNCCGMIGSWGMLEKNYDLSRRIASEMIRKLDRSDASVGVTDCPTCRMQMQHFSDKPIRHPVEIVADCLAE
ncbi:anaerobic glycerol-3-phosphate dehydrogenase sub unit C [Desulfonema ishimotonii]|uniref:D-lactate dehydrogenase (cytochrome) n=1 Tax=Desulfonema ishimotonii TaxID=45657 RepID=A0A401FXH0_9BACT|nr:anaerobic glycerol-3-phosphate dehydrogenase subunit C [Desulfonema ishimotonii]GBC61623.1 anaerobic glycerol-3-phosphate dehydrogenase sub unit C [Desulfonema ishimotonii]